MIGIFLVLTSAIAIDGELVRAGSLVEVSELEAKNLLHRGKARLATEADGAPALEVDEIEGDSPTDDDETEGDELTGDDGVNEVNLDRLNKTQLIELATQLGIEPGEMTKAQLVEAIEAKKSEE
jgi:hypothetical protein